MNQRTLTLSLLVGLIIIATLQFSNADDNIFSPEHNNNYLWGTYRPAMFFAMSTREATPLICGIFWHIGTPFSANDVRYDAVAFMESQDITYAWNMHNGIDYGHQTITDNPEPILFDVNFAKLNHTDNQQWFATLTVANQGNTTVIVAPYCTIESDMFTVGKDTGNQVSFSSTNHSISFLAQDFKFASSKTHINSFNPNNLWQVKTNYINTIYGINDKPEVNSRKGNFLFTQIPIPASEQRSFTMHYSNFGANPLAINTSQVIATKRQEFVNRFAASFPIDTPDHQIFAYEALSNLIGGMGYFYGSLIILPDNHRTKPLGLFTATPSRSKFPRSFLWDEGFHEKIICQWDLDLCKDAIWHFLNTMDDNGWIAREQARGAEAESEIPADAIAQNPSIANPPALIFGINEIVEQYLQTNSSDEADYLEGVYEKLEKWFQWFNMTQANPIMPDGFVWFGRNQNYNLPSGFDDFPRAYPNDLEVQLDIQVWMIFYSSELSRISGILG